MTRPSRGQPFRGDGSTAGIFDIFDATHGERGSGKIQSEIEAWRRRGTAHFPPLRCPISLVKDCTDTPSHTKLWNAPCTHHH
ncbi:hypothetical protein OYC64_002430 [Pagothenia borchgrevinki]|uniref:Uncharacterized protein n=1 Tax=Pagothenia borchgrevinki TaxID=8213 RepID=A0ABD2H8F6_PAGBO